MIDQRETRREFCQAVPDGARPYRGYSREGLPDRRRVHETRLSQSAAAHSGAQVRGVVPGPGLVEAARRAASRHHRQEHLQDALLADSAQSTRQPSLDGRSQRRLAHGGGRGRYRGGIRRLVGRVPLVEARRRQSRNTRLDGPRERVGGPQRRSRGDGRRRVPRLLRLPLGTQIPPGNPPGAYRG